MTETYTLALSLLDFVPNLAFAIGAYFLVRMVQILGQSLAVWTMILGSTLVFFGGTLKAIWKLLVTIGIGDFQWLSELQFVLLAPGFLLMLVSVSSVVRRERRAWQTNIMAMALWKIPLLAIMTLSSIGLHGVLGYLAWKRKAFVATGMFIIAIVCLLALAGMASGEQTIMRQWVEEIVNSIGQITFAIGSFLLSTRVITDMREDKSKPLVTPI